MRFDLIARAPDAHFNTIAKQHQDHAVFETNDAKRRQPRTQHDDMSVAAA